MQLNTAGRGASRVPFLKSERLAKMGVVTNDETHRKTAALRPPEHILPAEHVAPLARGGVGVGLRGKRPWW